MLNEVKRFYYDVFESKKNPLTKNGKEFRGHFAMKR